MNFDGTYNLIVGGALGLFTLGLSSLYILKGNKNHQKENKINEKDKKRDKNDKVPNLEIEDYPPANAINQNNEDKIYPIIRCENCNEIPTIKLRLSKKEVELKCEKEEKIEKIPFKSFFKTIMKYNDINCCQFCKNKNPSQKYYLCTTCSNKVLF